MSNLFLASHADVFEYFYANRKLDAPDPILIDQQRICQFADATGLNQLVHVDAEYGRTSQYGKTIAQGKLVESLAVGMTMQALDPLGDGLSLEYRGSDTTRCISPVRCGSLLRVEITVYDCMQVLNNGQSAVEATDLFLTVIAIVDRDPYFDRAFAMRATFRFNW